MTGKDVLKLIGMLICAMAGILVAGAIIIASVYGLGKLIVEAFQ